MHKTIFTPLTVKSMTIKNRIVMPPMGTNYGDPNGEFTEDHMKYYERRARGGVGLIIVENACIDFPLGSNGTTQLRIDHDRFIPGMYRLTEKLHQYGASVAIQINHAGASAVPDRIGSQAVSASDVPSKSGGSVPRPLTREEIMDIVGHYGKAAKRAVAGGFDAIEIHAGHSYLLCQFLSSLYNKRTDEFGGSFENRARIVKLVIEQIRTEVGPHFPIIMRFSADEFIKGGNTLEDTLQILEFLHDEVDIFNVSAAVNDTLQFQIDQMNLPDGWRSYLAKAVKDKFHKPVIASGNFRNPTVVDRVLTEGQADLIAIGRGLIADPDWVSKVQKGQEDMLRKCISCNIGCAGHRIALNRPIRCTINPEVIHGEDYKEKHVKKQTNVIVIGGGTAGLEAACTAAEVGCTTFLFEQKPNLGGLAREIAKLPDKKRIEDFPIYLEKRSESLKNLITFTNTRADAELIERFKPDLIVNATGSKPLLPPIPGLLERIDQENGSLLSIFGLLGRVQEFPDDMQGQKIAVIGGGAVGLDVVEFFTDRNADVTIVERMPELGRDLDLITKLSMMTIVKEKQVEVLTNTSLVEVAGDHFKVNADGADSDIHFDYGFVCLGMKPENTGLTELQNHFIQKNIEVINIGDSFRTRKILDGVREGRNVLSILEKIGAL
jgi:2,4-dienoyl-CoA reductase-like NADH-dependent reductase (Old Yellow Enzyme family)/NADPH-dependent 2,4-dienoyl-CoA reductase/sulfur reductase-like enzyme